MPETKFYPKKSRKPLQAIRYFCLECMGWDRRSPLDSERPYKDVKECTDHMCPLFDFRFGVNPFAKKRSITPEHLEALQRGRKKLSGKEQISSESTILT